MELLPVLKVRTNRLYASHGVLWRHGVVSSFLNVVVVEGIPSVVYMDAFVVYFCLFPLI